MSSDDESLFNSQINKLLNASMIQNILASRKKYVIIEFFKSILNCVGPKHEITEVISPTVPSSSVMILIKRERLRTSKTTIASISQLFEKY